MLFALFFGFSFAYAESQIVEQYTVDYEIDGGKVLSIELDSDFIELIIDIDTTDDGILEISIPRELLDAKFDNVDDVFFVLVDGFLTEYLELTNGDDSRTILIPFFFRRFTNWNYWYRCFRYWTRWNYFSTRITNTILG